MPDDETVPVTFSVTRLEKYDAAGQLFEVVEWRDGAPITIRPESPEWPAAIAALARE